MERIANLVRTAGSLRRKIWASLPIQVRLADFCTRLAVGATDAFGRGMYEIFIKNGVDGVPDPRGTEAKQFGTQAYRFLVSKFQNPQLVEDVLANFSLRFLSSGASHLKPGSSLKDAQNYVLHSLKNEAMNHLRKKYRKMEVTDTYNTSEGEEQRHELPIFDYHGDPTKEVSRKVRALMPRIRAKLNRIHPAAAQYVELRMIEGYSDVEIFGDPPMLDDNTGRQGQPLSPKSWGNRIKKEIKQVLYEELSEFAPREFDQAV